MITKAPLPPQSRLQKLFTYDPASGVIAWRERPERACGFVGQDGAFRIVFDKRFFFAHRIIWKIVYGVDPVEIDHINGDRKDNRIVNLRNVDRLANARNMPLSRANQSGCVGVRWNKKRERWHAYIYVGRKSIYLGYFHDKHEAIAARKNAEKALGFHPNHGRAEIGRSA